MEKNTAISDLSCTRLCLEELTVTTSRRNYRVSMSSSDSRSFFFSPRKKKKLTPSRLTANYSLTAFSMAADAHRSMLSGMFSFMKKTSRVRHNPESEGIYLSDLNADELDPEVAALYFPSSHRGPTVVKGIW